MPAPDSVMTIPALNPAVMAEVGVKENVEAVTVAWSLEESVTIRFLMAPQCAAGARLAKMANAKVIAFISMELTLLCNLEA